MFIENKNALKPIKSPTGKYTIKAHEGSKPIETTSPKNKVSNLINRINDLNTNKDNSILFDALFYASRDFLIKATSRGPVSKITIVNNKQKIAFCSIDGIISSLFDKIIIDKQIGIDSSSNYNYTLGINLINEQLKRNYKMELCVSGIMIPFSLSTFDSLTKEKKKYQYQ